MREKKSKEGELSLKLKYGILKKSTVCPYYFCEFNHLSPFSVILPLLFTGPVY
jgi:hypothetical protein